MTVRQKAAAGALLIGGVLLFAIGLFWIGDRKKMFSENFTVYAEFEGVSGLPPGAKVRVGGMDAGEVTEIEVPQSPSSKFRVALRVEEKFHGMVRQDSVATIETEGLLGNKFLQIDPGTEQQARAADGSTIRSKEPFDWPELMHKAKATMEAASDTLQSVKGEVGQTVAAIGSTAKNLNGLVIHVRDDVESILASGGRIARNVDTMVDKTARGEGFLGKAIHDETLYESFQSGIHNIEKTSYNISEAVAELRSRGIVEDIDATVENVREATGTVRKTVSGLEPNGDGMPGIGDELRRTLSDAREAMSDLSENTEAIKQNWFFRGFFKERGFYDLDRLNRADYLSGEFAPEKGRHRVWLHSFELFDASMDGAEQLSENGRNRLSAAMAEFLRYPRRGPLIVEGYCSASGDQQFVRSRQRAAKVRAYLVERYELKPTYVGIIEMGAARASNGALWDGVALIQYFDPADGKG